MDYQDLKGDDRPGRYWSHGRVWFRRAGNWYEKHFGTLQVEWTVPCSHCGWGLTFGGGDSGRNFGFTVAIPFLLTLYATLEGVFPMYPFGTDFDRGHDRRVDVYFFDRAIWYHLWVGSMASWSRDYPWCRWWRQGSFHFANLLGKQTHVLVELQIDIPIQIPMPEGVYHALATRQERSWKRRFWFRTSRREIDVKVPKGIPFAGKGENSWDCGDDGLYGYGVTGDSLEHAIAHGVESVLTSRRRYGHASADAIKEALA